MPGAQSAGGNKDGEGGGDGVWRGGDGVDEVVWRIGILMNGLDN